MWTEGPGNNSCTNNQHKASTLDTGFGPRLADYQNWYKWTAGKGLGGNMP